jgi:hypothetical protein
VSLAGIAFGPANEAQTLTVTATSSNPALTTGLGVNYTSPSATGTLTFTPSASTNGTATVTVTVRDSGGTASGGVDTMIRTFTVTVDLPVPPTLAIEMSGGKALVSWPGNSSPLWALQYNTNLSNPMGWVPEGTTPSLVSGRFTVTNTPAGMGRFYRLAR